MARWRLTRRKRRRSLLNETSMYSVLYGAIGGHTSNIDQKHTVQAFKPGKEYDVNVSGQRTLVSERLWACFIDATALSFHFGKIAAVDQQFRSSKPLKGGEQGTPNESAETEMGMIFVLIIPQLLHATVTKMLSTISAQ